MGAFRLGLHLAAAGVGAGTLAFATDALFAQTLSPADAAAITERIERAMRNAIENYTRRFPQDAYFDHALKVALTTEFTNGLLAASSGLPPGAYDEMIAAARAGAAAAGTPIVSMNSGEINFNATVRPQAPHVPGSSISHGARRLMRSAAGSGCSNAIAMLARSPPETTLNDALSIPVYASNLLNALPAAGISGSPARMAEASRLFALDAGEWCAPAEAIGQALAQYAARFSDLASARAVASGAFGYASAWPAFAAKLAELDPARAADIVAFGAQAGPSSPTPSTGLAEKKLPDPCMPPAPPAQVALPPECMDAGFRRRLDELALLEPYRPRPLTSQAMLRTGQGEPTAAGGGVPMGPVVATIGGISVGILIAAIDEGGRESP